MHIVHTFLYRNQRWLTVNSSQKVRILEVYERSRYIDACVMICEQRPQPSDQVEAIPADECDEDPGSCALILEMHPR